MNCQQADKYIYAYCDARLSPELVREFEEHLLGCEECRDLMVLIRMENEALLEALAADNLPLDDQFTARVMAALPAAAPNMVPDNTPGVKPARFWRPAFYLAATAAVVLLLAAVTPGWFDNFKQAPQTDIAVNDTGLLQQQPASSPLMVQDEAMTDSGQYYGAAAESEELLDSVADYDDTRAPRQDTDNNNDQQTNPHLQVAMADEALFPSEAAPMLRDGTAMAKEAHLTEFTESPYRYRTYSVNLVKPVQDLQLVPENLPANYELKPNGTDMFVYTNINSKNTVKIVIKPYDVSSSDLQEAAAEEMLKTKAAPEPLPQHLEVITQYEEDQYLVSLDSDLDREELLNLASNIQLNLAP